MARVCDNNGHGWDFVRAGQEHPYKEDSFIAIVSVEEDLSTTEEYVFKLKVLEANMDIRSFTVSATKGQTGTYNGAAQFYEEGRLEYIPLPLGAPWPYNFRKPVTLFSKDILERCVASQSEIDEAIAKGKKMQYNDENGRMTAYLLNGRTYVTEMLILPEAFNE